jgi:hypothetical protein
MMGDFMARNAPNFNSFTKFEVKLDLVSIEYEAYKRAKSFFDDFENNEDYTISFADFECDPETQTQKADRERTEKDAIIQEFMDSYRNFDAQFWLDYNQLLIDIDILYEEINKDKEFDVSFHEDLYEMNGMCYNITYKKEEDDDTDLEGT